MSFCCNFGFWFILKYLLVHFLVFNFVQDISVTTILTAFELRIFIFITHLILVWNISGTIFRWSEKKEEGASSCWQEVCIWLGYWRRHRCWLQSNVSDQKGLSEIKIKKEDWWIVLDALFYVVLCFSPCNIVPLLHQTRSLCSCFWPRITLSLTISSKHRILTCKWAWQNKKIWSEFNRFQSLCVLLLKWEYTKLFIAKFKLIT